MVKCFTIRCQRNVTVYTSLRGEFYAQFDGINRHANDMSNLLFDRLPQISFIS